MGFECKHRLTLFELQMKSVQQSVSCSFGDFHMSQPIHHQNVKSSLTSYSTHPSTLLRAAGNVHALFLHRQDFMSCPSTCHQCFCIAFSIRFNCNINNQHMSVVENLKNNLQHYIRFLSKKFYRV